MNQQKTIKVWDPFVRIFHWGLVFAFAVAYLTEEDILSIHTLAGYVVLGLLSLRLRSEERRVGKECRSRWSPYH